MLSRLLALLLVAVSTLGAWSCSSLIGAEDYQDSAEAICGMSVLCFEDNEQICVSRIERRLNLASASVRSSWLTKLSDEDCLSSCFLTRRCLDLLPVCGNSECTKQEDCCGFLGGTADCEAGKCCGGAGTRCSSNADCCSNVPCSPVFGTCGGVVCRELDAKCVNDFDCCSDHCGESGRCEEVCSDEHCQVDSDCCQGFCNTEGRCDTSCVQEGELCPNHNCCNGVPCNPMLDGSERCSTEACLPPGADCTRGEFCCSNICIGEKCSKPCVLEGQSCGGDTPCCEGDCSNGICVRACTELESACASPLDCCSGICDPDTSLCGCSNLVCTRNENCCTGECVGGACKPSCTAMACTNASVCKLGPPLGEDDGSGGFVSCPGLEDCVPLVCAQDEYCCCGAWDALCVQSASELCGTC